MKTLPAVLLSLLCTGLCATAQTLANYQATLLAQTPNSYFTFDGGSLTSVTGVAATLTAFPASVGSQFTPDVFGHASNSIYFTGSTDAASDNSESTDHVISGGGTATLASTAAGSITLLFRTTDPGPPPSGAPGQHYIFSAGGDFGASNSLSLLFESSASTNEPSALKLRFGDTSTTILSSNNVANETWYFFALTYNEAAAVGGLPNTNKGTWYLGRLGGAGALASGITTNASNVVAGDALNFFVGANTNGKSSFRNPGDGRVDEFATWNRQLSAAEIQAQFGQLPNVPVPSRISYQTVVSGQSPAHYFKLDGNSVDSVSGTLTLSTNGATPLLGYSSDYFFINPPSDVFFSAGADALSANVNLLNGGGTYTGNPGPGQGSLSFLFHPLAGTNYTGQKFLFSAGGSTGNSNAFALFFENTTSANPGSLKLRFGDSSSVVLPVTNLLSEWYYFAATFDETRTNKQVNWWLAQPSQTLQSGFFSATNGSLAGGAAVFYIGNEVDGGSGFRAVNSGRQSNGQIDEFAIWNRLLTTNEVAAQFSALTVQPPPPTLGIAVSAGNVILSWPSSTDSNYALESTLSLLPSSWSGAGSAVIVGNQYAVTNAITSTQTFYRLRKP
ncbi:MAG: hypothetical protein JWR19_4303 [Pedosphaera sp.]|nr:hypothetical protein [Pedosphaera sp.]